MVRLQRRDPRDGGITVESTHYRLDAQGCIEVTEAHAEILARADGRNWLPPGSPTAESTTPEAVPGVGRRPRTRAELEAAALAEGLPMPAHRSERSPEPEPEMIGPAERTTAEALQEEWAAEAAAELIPDEVTPVAAEAAPSAVDTVGINAGVMADGIREGAFDPHDSLGVMLGDNALVEPAAAPVEEAAPAEEAETIEVSPTMTLGQLRAVATKLGMKVPRGIKHDELFELIRAQGESA